MRESTQVIGDLFSLSACNKVGGRRLVAMMDEFNMDSLEPLAAHILERSREASLEAIRKIPAGTWSNEMMVDGYDKPVKIVAKMTIGADGIDVDYTGTSGISAFGINVPFCYTEAYSSFGIKCIVAPKVPNNEGSLSVIRITAPEGCILNAIHPAPVATRHITGQMLPDVMFGCLGQALKDAVPAEGTSCLWNLFAMGGDSRVEADVDLVSRTKHFNVMSFHSGGTGARPGKDGLSATAFPSGVKNCPIEITEALSPILVTRKEYRTDSGGPGEFRGGLGQVMEARHLDDVPFMISANFDRVIFPPRGRERGMNGAIGVVRTGSGTPLRGKGQQTIQQGETFVMEMPGGGGLGDPRRRDAGTRRCRRAFRAGLPEAALRDYGVVLNADGSVDVAATALRRKRPPSPYGQQPTGARYESRRPADRDGRPHLSDPVLRSRERHPHRPGGRKIRLRLGVGQRPHDDPALRARRVSGAAALLGAAGHLRLPCVGHEEAALWHRHPGAADAPRHRGHRQADRHARPFRQGAAGARRRHRRLPRGVRRAAARKLQRGDIVEEGVQALTRLLTDRVASFDGEFYKYRDVELWPKPMQKRIPILIGGNNPNNIRRAVEHASGWLPAGLHVSKVREGVALLKQHAERIGRNWREVEVAPQYIVRIDRDREKALRDFGQPDVQASRVAEEVHA